MHEKLKSFKGQSKSFDIVTNADRRKERVVIEKRNKPVAVIIGYEVYKRLEALEDFYESRLLVETLKRDKVYSLEDVLRKESEYRRAMERQIALMEKGFDLGTKGEMAVSRDELYASREKTAK